MWQIIFQCPVPSSTSAQMLRLFLIFWQIGHAELVLGRKPREYKRGCTKSKNGKVSSMFCMIIAFRAVSRVL